MYRGKMKTTVQIDDALFRAAKQYAARQGIPLRAVIERGLETVLRGRPTRRQGFRLKTVTTRGQGLVCDGDWNTIRALIYEGRGE